MYSLLSFYPDLFFHSSCLVFSFICVCVLVSFLLFFVCCYVLGSMLFPLFWFCYAYCIEDTAHLKFGGMGHRACVHILCDFAV